MGYFKIDDEFCLFEIMPRYPASGNTYLITYGDRSTCIEFRISVDSSRIFDIQCIYLDSVLQEPSLRLPDIRSNPEIKKAPFSVCHEKDDSRRIPCLINLTRDEMDFIISADSSAVTYCYADDRVEYYYDDDFKLLYFKVLALTEEEYTFLKSCGATGKHRH